MQSSLDTALTQLEAARLKVQTALGLYRIAEKEGGIDSPEVDKVQAELVDPAHEAVAEAEKQVAGARCDTIRDVLRKAHALLDPLMRDDAKERLKADIGAVLTDDPLVDLCARWKRIHRAEQAMFKNDTAGWFETPELADMRQAKREIEAQIMDHMPRTPEALASLVDMYWITDGPASLTGSEGWEHEMNNPTNRLLAHIRRGAAHIAGLDRG